MGDGVSPVGSTNHPQSPHISYSELWKQFKADVYGKEVQSAATYSYMWMADQMGHVCVGILVNQITTFGARRLWQFLVGTVSPRSRALSPRLQSSPLGRPARFSAREQSATGLFPWAANC